MERLMVEAKGGGDCLGIVGLMFCPSEQELLAYYLYNKVRDTPTPMFENFVRECDLYGCQELREIWDLHQDSMMHDNNGDLYFTQSKKKTNKSSRISRRVSSSFGIWASEDAAKDICFSDDGRAMKLGSKKRFQYENSDNPEQDVAWIMHEYKLDPSLCFPGMNDSYVVCRIRKNSFNEIIGNKTREQKKKPKRKLHYKSNGCGEPITNQVGNYSDSPYLGTSE